MPNSEDTRVWKCGRFELSLERPLVMGILNVTPDSFSDGGRFERPADAIAGARELAAAGADIVDVGGESTRPGAEPVSPEEEFARVAPVVTVLVGDGVPVSIDTRNATVAAGCIELGASILNDVSGFGDPAMLGAAASSAAGCVIMHMLGDPRTMQEEPAYDDVVGEVGAYLAQRAGALEAAGVARERIVVDPGIGFGKTTEHNLELLRGLGHLRKFGYPIMIGASRKRFIGEITRVEAPAQRLPGSLTVAVWAAAHGAAVLRVHDVAETVQALRLLSRLMGPSQ